MKELSIEEKAKAYDRVLSIAKNIYGASESKDILCTLETIFPQLQEPDDEDKIMKELIYNIIVSTDYTPSSKEIFSVYGKTKEDAFAWLEKQVEQKQPLPTWKYKKDSIPLSRDSIILNKYGCVAKSPSGALVSDVWVMDYDELAKLPKEEYERQGEQKPFDYENVNIQQKDFAPKVESKFHEGDWVIDKQGIVHQIANVVENVTNHTYGYDIVGGGYFNDNNEGVRLWTIQDAKDGDVLATLDYILVFKEFLKNDGGISYCHYDFGAGNPQFIWSEDKNWYFGKEAIIHPATKEQRDLLFQKMKEAGYEWDADKKELKKIEHNVQLTEFEEAVKDLMNDYRDAIGDNDATVEEVKEHAAYMLSLIHQNPAWSEEDEHRVKDTIYFLDTAKKHYASAVELDACIDWLKSLKDRVQPQPKQEWSEEDKGNLLDVKCIIDEVWNNQDVREEIDHSGEELESLWHWLDNIWQRVEYPQNTWKPSDEQMERLKGIINSLPYQKVLYSLYQDLLKLK